ncbi:MAG: glycosyltransferase family 4 protein [Verrucomicrobiota bacterium]
MKIVFYCKEAAKANIDNYLDLGASGTVSAMILASHGLTLRGHEVVVLNRSESGVYQGTRHLRTESPEDVSHHLADLGAVDVFIANGWAGAIFGEFEIPVPTKVHWIHNFIDQVPVEKAMAVGRINYGVCISANQLGTWWKSPVFSRITNIPNCVDAASLEGKAPDRARENKIMFIGATRESKGFHDGLRIFLQFHARHPEYKFYVAGGAGLHGTAGPLSANGIFEQEYEDRCLKSLLYDRIGILRPEIVLLGRIPRSEVLRHLTTTKVALVNPSWTSEPETFCISAVEAQGMGVPVVSTFRGGLPEVIQDGDSGILVKGRDDRSMVAALERIIEDDHLAARFAAAGRSQVRERFSVDRIAAEWELKLRKMVAGELFRGNMLKAVRIKIHHKLRR